MKKVLFCSLLFLIFFIGCSDGNNTADLDSTVDSDFTDNDDVVFIDEEVDDDTEDQDIDLPDEDSDADPQYVSCYDEIPDEPYEGLFADPLMEVWVRRALGYENNEEITESDLEEITEIFILGRNDLRGLEKLVNLEVFYFEVDGNVYDFTPLSNLSKLQKIGIIFNKYSETTNMNCLDGSFSKLTSIEELEINRTDLKDISPIEQLTNLRILDLSENKIEFLPENMGNLQKLEELYLYGNKIDDILPLETLTNLSKLALNYNNVKDILPIKKMSKLARFNASNNNIADISVIENLHSLISFSAHINKITTLPVKRQLFFPSTTIIFTH
jgi:Leucine-rich repeat (LRR) protein